MKENIKARELRYYEVPQDDILIALHGERWRRVYGEEDDPLHFHNLMEIGICLEGEGVLRLEGREHRYHSGMISVIPAHVPHATIGERDALSSWEYIFLDCERIFSLMYQGNILLKQRMREAIDQPPIFRECADEAGLYELARMILAEMKGKPDMYRECSRMLAVAFLIRFARRSKSVSLSAERMRQRRGFEQIRPALELIQSRYASLGGGTIELAKACHISESYFRRIFKENVGMTPVEYLNFVRIRRACDLIWESAYSMGEIAAMTGYATVSAFNRNFREKMGTSPYHWKKSVEKQGNTAQNLDGFMEGK